MLEESEQSEESKDELTLGFISNLSENETSFEMQLLVEGKHFKFEIDSDARKSVIHILDFKIRVK